MIRVLLLALFFAGAATGHAREGRIRVLTTFLPVYCITANVAGDAAEVENLLPGGVGPHDYSFSLRDRRKLADADLIVINGLGVEDWLLKTLRGSSDLKRKPVAILSKGLDKELIDETTALKGGGKGSKKHTHKHDHKHDHGHHHGDTNPHIWLDPRLAMHGVTNVMLALEKADPKNGSVYRANAAAYIARLQALDKEMEAGLAEVRRVPFITYHDAFPYFVRRYQLNLVGIVEEIPDVEPSAKYRAALMRTARDQGVKVLFTEPQFSSKLIEQLARDLKISVAELDPLETGNLVPGAYEEGMRRNLKSLQQALK